MHTLLIKSLTCGEASVEDSLQTCSQIIVVYRFNRGWFYHKEHKLWLTRVPNESSFVKTPTFEQGAFYFFDHNTWEMGRKVHSLDQFL